MKSILTVVLIAIAISSYAQTNTKPNYQYQIKLYALTTPNVSAAISSNKTINGQLSHVSFNHILNPTIAANKSTKNGNRHEVELTALSINESTERTTLSYPANSMGIVSYGTAVRAANVTLRYEYLYVLIKDKKFEPSIGVAISPFYAKYTYTPLIASRFPFRETVFGVQTFIIPRISYNISKRLFMDLNVPLKVTENKFSSRVDNSPTLPISEQHTNNSNFIAFQDMLYIRLGIGLNL